ncbi:hypothetical protein HYV86_06915 [Candidatus Woesearchaeota archaeon]|nr:hypothetical protein [Candidatus Woesearchaeota archaeon]
MKWVILLLLLLPMALAAVDFDQGLDPQDQAMADQILAPVMKIYNLIKYAASTIGVLMLVFAAITFMTAGGEQIKRERAKLMGAGVIIGLILIWVAPMIVRFFFS